MKLTRGTLFLLLASTAAMLGAALGQEGRRPVEWKDAMAGARKEAKAVMYSQAVPAVNERLKLAFEKAYPGMQLEIGRIVVNLPGVLEQERKSGTDGADLVITAEPQWAEELAKAGYLQRPNGPAAKSWPARFMVGGHAPVVIVLTTALAYNTNLVKSGVSGYQDLLRPEFKGKFGISEPVQGMLVAWYDWLEKSQGRGYLVKLAAQNPKLYIGTPPMTQAAAAGEIMVAALTIPSSANPLIEKGAPLKVVIPRPGFGGKLVAGALSWAKRPNAAALLLDYLMSAPGQTVLVGAGESASPLPNIPGSLDITSMELYDSDRYNASIVAAYREEWNKTFKGR